MGKGSIGTNCGMMINTRNKKKHAADCTKCRNGRTVDKVNYCMLSGNIGVNRHVCNNYVGEFILWSAVSKRKKKKRR